ncbi:hypothetical protein PY257_14580 [Ramlibacter sp. H39-3-26]|nr:hypothetical protein [Ramlibacter sp. H39-3-26]
MQSSVASFDGVHLVGERAMHLPAPRRRALPGTPITALAGASNCRFQVQPAWNGEFQERWTLASGRNKVSGESGKAMKP